MTIIKGVFPCCLWRYALQLINSKENRLNTG